MHECSFASSNTDHILDQSQTSRTVTLGHSRPHRHTTGVGGVETTRGVIQTEGARRYTPRDVQGNVSLDSSVF
jgi:hypothetical protein